MASCRAALRTTPFRFEDAWARVLDGADEGLYGWIAVRPNPTP